MIVFNLRVAFIASVAVAKFHTIHADAVEIKEQAIATFSISDLQRLSLTNSNPNENDDDQNSRYRGEEFRAALSTTGLIAVRLDDDDDDDNDHQNLQGYYSRDRRIALDGLCSCVDHPEFLKLDQTHDLIFPRSTTQRTSVATATVGLNHPLPLPDGLDETCGVDVVHAMEGLRDVVASVSNAFITALDTNIVQSRARVKPSSSSTVLLRDKQRGKSYNSISDIVSAANHLEHFHVYTNNYDSTHTNEEKEAKMNNNNNNNNIAWDWHTDAGLFLVFVPAWDCNNQNDGNNNNNNGIDKSFYYRDGRNGTPIRAKFDGDRTAIVMLGQGAQDWLNLPKPFNPKNQSLLKATSHSVRWEESNPSSSLLIQYDNHAQPQRRAWYGMMHLVPETAMVYGGKTLREVKESLSLSHQSKNNYQPPLSSLLSVASASDSNGVSLGCGNAFPSLSQQQSRRNDGYFGDRQQQQIPNGNFPISRRRHLESKDPSMCNNVTNFFCWMTCMDIPDVDHVEHYVDNDYSLYCIDESVLDKSGELSTAHDGCIDVHNPACVGAWEKTIEGVPAANIDISTNTSDVEYPFCYGGTSMYMEGFQWIQSSTCVILLIPAWVLNTPWKYALAVIGTFFVAIGLEKFIQQRRKVMTLMGSGINRLLVSAIFYGVQLSIGYLLMLIIMIYSGVLFLAVISGLVTGHILFNSKDAIWPIFESPNLDETSTAFENNCDVSNVNNSNNSNGNGNETNKEETGRCCGHNCSSLSLPVEMNPLRISNASERALDEGSTHCQEFDNTEYYGSLDGGEDSGAKVCKSETVAAVPPTKKSKQSMKSKCKVDSGVPEGSTPCCQHGC